MNFNKLKTRMRIVALTVAICFFVVACNNEQSANNSTSGVHGDSTNAADASATKPVVKKRTGKAAITRAEENNAEEMVMDKQGFYNRTEILPAYNGGQNALENYIVNNIEYPQEAIDNNAEGVVQVRFAVDEKGNVSNVSTIGNRLGYGLEEEAVRIVSNMPKWTPGQVKGKNVKTWRTLPINYRLEG